MRFLHVCNLCFDVCDATWRLISPAEHHANGNRPQEESRVSHGGVDVRHAQLWTNEVSLWRRLCDPWISLCTSPQQSDLVSKSLDSVQKQKQRQRLQQTVDDYWRSTNGKPDESLWGSRLSCRTWRKNVYWKQSKTFPAEVVCTHKPNSSTFNLNTLGYKNKF